MEVTDSSQIPPTGDTVQSTKEIVKASKPQEYLDVEMDSDDLTSLNVHNICDKDRLQDDDKAKYMCLTKFIPKGFKSSMNVGNISVSDSSLNYSSLKLRWQ
ncbi:MAG: hypothetical protein JJV94_03135 [Sulfurospirillum sp.]|nr:hypothetical protein [Sulfurospirillum sp.]